jgi:hypothetical protein
MNSKSQAAYIRGNIWIGHSYDSHGLSEAEFAEALASLQIEK